MRKLSIYLLLLTSFFLVQQIALGTSDYSNYGNAPVEKPRPAIDVSDIRPLAHVPGNPILNDGFEDSPVALVNWIVVDQPGSAGSWFVQSGGGSPLNGFPVPAPPEGIQAAMTDQGGGGSHILYQDFAVSPKGGTLSFDLFARNAAAAWTVPSPETLDYTVIPNQHVRVDIMDPLAPVDDVGAGVLANLFLTSPTDPLTFGYRRITASLDAFAGQTIRLRFAEVDNQLFLNMGIDNVVVLSTALGMLADNATNSVIVFNADNDTVIGVVPIPLNGGVIGDVSISNDGTLGFVTNFANQVYVIDLMATPPVLAGGTNPILISNLGEDIANSPDGDFLVICDGGIPAPVSVVDIAARAETSTFAANCNGVDVCQDNSVLIADVGAGVRRLTLSGGVLADTGESKPDPGVMNPSCVPGGVTGLDVTASVNSFAIPGLAPVAALPLSGSGQSVITNPAGSKVFARTCGPFAVDTFDYDPVTGILTPSLSIPVGPVFACYFGIDEIAIHPNSSKLYVSEPGILNVYDPTTGAPIASITNPAISDPTGVTIRRVPNRAPVAVDDTATVAEDSGTTSIPVLSNDLDQDFDPLTITVVTDPPGGTAVINGSNIDYTPDPDFNGADSFTYTISDGMGNTDTATVDVTVTEVNDPPIAVDDAVTTAEDTPLTFAASDLTANDSPGPANESGQTLTVISVDATSAQGGTVALVAGNITYTPPANYNGPDTFNYTVEDDGTTNGVPDPQTAIATVEVTVTEVNDPPVANTDFKSTLINTAITFPASDLLLNDSAGPANESGQTLTVLSVSPMSELGGTVSLVAGNITYTPPVNFHGADSFDYVIEDDGTTNGNPDPLQTTGVVSIAVNCPITVSPAVLPSGYVGAPYSQTLTASGGTAPYTFTVTAGVLPAGLSLNPVTGVLSGTPTTPGISSFVVTATDAVDCTGTQLYTVVVGCREPGLLYGAFHTGFNSPSTLVTLDPATGAATPVGPIGFNSVSALVFDASGTLYGAGLRPSDGLSVILTIDPATGAGTEIGPTGVSRISDLSFRSDGVLYAYVEPIDELGTVNLATGAVTILGPTFVSCCGNGMGFSSADVLYHANQSELHTLDQTTGVASFVATLGFTPPLDSFPRINAMKFDPASGSLFGSANDGGGENYLATIDPVTGVVTIIGPTVSGLDAIAFALGGVKISPATLPGGNVTVPYSQTITASGGAPPYTFTVTTGALPNGLSLNPLTGVISGTPTTAGPFAFVITATDETGCTGSQLYVIDINEAPCPVITLSPASLPGGTLGFAYSQTVSASGGVAPYSFAVTSGALPAGLSLDPATGVISGTPSALGTSAFVITATDANGCIGSQTYTVTIECPAISIAPATLPDGIVGAAYSATVTASGGIAPYAYTISAGSLPPGLSLDPETGTISGTPTAEGVYSFVVTASDANGCDGARFYTIRIGCPVITLSPSGLPNGVLGVPYSATFGASGGVAPYSFTVGAGALPPGLSLNPVTGEIAGTPTVAGVYTFEVTATDANGCAGSQIFTLAIDCASISISPATLADGTTGAAYSQTVSATGGTAPYTFALSAGGLPPGLSLNGATGEISGTPLAQGTFSFVISATDASDCTASRFYTIRINCPLIAVSPSSLPNGTTTVPYSQTLTASGGTAPYSFAVSSGSLPPGLSLNPSTGVLDGTPTVTGVFAFEVTATDSNDCTGTQLYAITVNLPACPTITLSPAALPGGTIGVAYSQTISASGSAALPYTFSVSSGVLPPGLALNPATGLISGTPTTGGVFAFVITATDTNDCSGSQLYTIDIGCPEITIAPTSLPNGVTGTPYSQTITATGSSTAITFAVTAGALPPGLALNSTTGVLSGTPTNAGTFAFTITATDANGCSASLGYLISISCPVIDVSPSTLPGGVVGALYSQTITASGGTGVNTFAVSSGSLPPGLTLSAAGLLSGTPTLEGIFAFQVTATDENGCAGTRLYLLAVGCATINLPPSLFPEAVVGTPYSQTIAATGGTAPYNYAVTSGALPAGLSLNAATGEISGIPSAAGTYSFTVTATDANGCTGAWSYTIDAVCPDITLLSSLPDGEVGTAYSATVTATGGTAPYTFAVTAGLLPPGLTLDPATGVVSGTPTTVGDFTFDITATDFYDCTGAQTYTVHVSPACLFCDDFEDGVLDPNWTYIKPSWTETQGALNGTPVGRKAIAVATPVWAGCSICSVETTMETAGGPNNRVWFLGWYQDKKNTVELLMKQGSSAWILKQRVNGVVVAKQKFSEFINNNTPYKVRIVFDGTNFTLFIDDVQAFTLKAVGSPFGTVGFQVKDTTAEFEYVTAN